MKKLTASVLVLLLATTSTLANSFTDTNSHDYRKAIELVKDRGVIGGYSDGSFKPDKVINRAELTKIVIGATSSKDKIEQCKDSSFPDVPSDAWFAPYICMAKSQEIVSGYSDGTFQPEKVVNFVEALKIVSGAFGRNPTIDPNEWYRGYVEDAGEDNLIPPDVESFNTGFTRGQLAEMIARFITLKDGGKNSLKAFVGDKWETKVTYENIKNGKKEALPKNTNDKSISTNDSIQQEVESRRGNLPAGDTNKKISYIKLQILKNPNNKALKLLMHEFLNKRLGELSINTLATDKSSDTAIAIEKLKSQNDIYKDLIEVKSFLELDVAFNKNKISENEKKIKEHEALYKVQLSTEKTKLEGNLSDQLYSRGIGFKVVGFNSDSDKNSKFQPASGRSYYTAIIEVTNETESTIEFFLTNIYVLLNGVERNSYLSFEGIATDYTSLLVNHNETQKTKLTFSLPKSNSVMLGIDYWSGETFKVKLPNTSEPPYIPSYSTPSYDYGGGSSYPQSSNEQICSQLAAQISQFSQSPEGVQSSGNSAIVARARAQQAAYGCN